MKGLDRQWQALARQLETLTREAQRARGQARKRLKRLERRTRVTVERALRATQPTVRRALADAARVGRGVRAGVKAGAAAYRKKSRT
jgi:hypothetical protein